MSWVLNLRLSDRERALLEMASSQSLTSLDDFVRRKSLEAAEADMIERSIVASAAEEGERFGQWAASPARKPAALKEPGGRRPAWR